MTVTCEWDFSEGTPTDHVFNRVEFMVTNEDEHRATFTVKCGDHGVSATVGKESLMELIDAFTAVFRQMG